MDAMSVEGVCLGDDVDNNGCVLRQKGLVVDLLPFVLLAHLGESAVANRKFVGLELRVLL